MSARPRKRTLAFERLEPKSIPSSLLLLMVTSGPELVTPDTVEVGTWSGDSTAEMARPALAASSKWQFDPDPSRLLRFLAAETSDATQRGELDVYLRPTQQQCDGADAMMKLDDDELRTMILLEYEG